MTDATVPDKARRLAASRLKTEVEKTKRGEAENVNLYTKYAREAAEKLLRAEQTAAEEVRGWAEAVTLLRAAGFRPKTSEHNLRVRVRTTQKRLTAVYKAIGRLDGANAEKETEDGPRGLVRVTLYSVRYPKVSVSYVRKLLPGDKCRIVPVEVPARTEYQLVCERG